MFNQPDRVANHFGIRKRMGGPLGLQNFLRSRAKANLTKVTTLHVGVIGVVIS